MPLSPLLFILEFDALGTLLNHAISKKSIVGVQFPELAITTLHIFYVDDKYLIIRVVLSYILELRHILYIFVEVSRLVCA